MLVKWRIHEHMYIGLRMGDMRKYDKFGGSGSEDGLELEGSNHGNHVKGGGGGCLIFLNLFKTLW